MIFHKTSWTVHGSTALFVLLWSSGAIFSELGLEHASPFAFLVLRFGLAFSLLLTLALRRHRWLPAPGSRARAAATGLVLIGSYPICYLLALEHGVTPGVLATVLGVQPILTLALLERHYSIRRLLGLGLSMGGLVLVVYQSLRIAHFPPSGMLFSLAALLCMTGGSILQKGVRQAPMDVLPLQYLVALLLCLAFVPFRPFDVDFSTGFLIALIWLGILISVVAQCLFYRLIQAGNLVNVTSLFYLVPIVTAIMDYLVLGNRLSPLSLAGMGAIVLGLMLVFRSQAGSRHH
ncbi:DMT family transporter [Paralcaligenes sp. KSB-10]|uniref:DMT family transporter n=1 Tax=Paralcaligenes sp. KSB-10 TaxID=2901142 RepID=UPI001E31C098|nr:DMT family transporter [Paralcaligenes sp. KSB-10]UHL64030.1 DMT family transporter [Paralcaligenes sp. KSB-10]